MTQQLVMKPLGLITQPNKYGQYAAGALSSADRAIMRDIGTIAAAQSWKQGIATGFDGSRAFYHIPKLQKVLNLFQSSASSLWRYTWVDLVSLTNPGYGNLQLNDEASVGFSLPDDARYGLFTYRDHTLLNCQRGALAWDFPEPTSTAQATVRRAGMYPPAIASVVQFVTNSTPSALNTDTACHVVAMFRRKYADGYELISAPSPAMHIGATAPANIRVTVSYSFSYAKAGDVLELYRTRAQAYLVAGSTNTGQDYYLDTAYTLTTSDVSAGFVVLDLTAIDASLGVAMYVNQGQQGAAASTSPPPTAKCSAIFRGYAFYGNRIDPASITLRVPSFWGTMGDSTTGSPSNIRANGIGNRRIVGTTTTSSGVITGVSTGDMVGIKVGQRVSATSPSAAFVVSSNNSRITSITATTITVGPNVASVSGSQTIDFEDMVELDGQPQGALNFQQFAANVSTLSTLNASNMLVLQCLGRVYPDKAAAPAATGGRADTIPAGDGLILSRFQLSGTTAQPITIRATNGDNWAPKLPRIELAETARSIAETPVPNGLSWGVEGEHENCPAVNIQPVGKGEIYGLHSTRDALWITTSDGLFRMSGTGGTVALGYDWRWDPVDPTLYLAAPRAWCVLRDQFVMYSNRGLVSIDSSANMTNLTEGRLGDVITGQPWNAPSYTTSTAILCCADLTNDEVVFRAPNAGTGKTWVYNFITDAFTQGVWCQPAASQLDNLTDMVWSAYLQGLMVAFEGGGNTANFSNVQAGTYIADSMFLKFQPFYGDNPFAMYHWQQLDVAYDCPLGSSAPTLNATVNNSFAIGAKNMVVPSQPESEFSRASFGIPRNAPAIANSIAVALSTNRTGFAGDLVKLMGLSMQLEPLTEQRKRR